MKVRMESNANGVETGVKEEPTDANTQCQGQIDHISDWKSDGNVECRVTLERMENISSEILPSIESQVRWRTLSGTQMDEGQDERITKSDHTEGFIRDPFRTQNPSTDDEIDIKYEGSGFEYNSTSNVEGDHGIDSDPDSTLSNMNPNSGSQRTINSEQIELSQFYYRLLRCEQDCETCQKYIRELSEHIRDTHAECQPTRQPVLIDPIDTDKSSPVEIKSEFNEDIERMDCSISEKSDTNVESVVKKSSESDPNYKTSHDLNPQRKSGRNVEEELESDLTQIITSNTKVKVTLMISLQQS